MFSARKSSAFVAALAAACAILAPSAQASWSVTSGTAATTTSQLSGVACVTASNCLLVGLQSGTTSRALASRWNGSTFAALTPLSRTSELYGAACTSATLCFAVGADYTGTAVPHVETYNGTSWTTTTSQVPSGSTFAQLSRVACPGATSCFAAGSYQTTTTTLPLVERWNGTTWSLQSLSLPSGATNAALSGIACTSASLCTAVGYFESSGNPRRTMALRWNGTSWSSQSAANQGGATFSELQGVACTSSTSCLAVGDYLDGSSVQHSLAELWDGATWTLKTVADPSTGTDPGLADVACSSSSACSAVGGYSGAASVEPLVGSWNGSAWSLPAVPKPAGASDATLTGVACPSTCVADGVSITGGNLHPLVETGP